MLKFSLLILLSFSVLSAYSQTSSRKTKKIKKYVVNTQQRFQRDVNTLKEGYTSYGNQFFIKEYIVKGTVNFLSVTNGIALSSYQAGTSSSVKLYFLQRNNEAIVHEIFVHNQSVVSIVAMSKAAMVDAFQDEPLFIEKVNQLKKTNKKSIIKLLTEYNEAHTLPAEQVSK